MAVITGEGLIAVVAAEAKAGVGIKARLGEVDAAIAGEAEEGKAAVVGAEEGVEAVVGVSELSRLVAVEGNAIKGVEDLGSEVDAVVLAVMPA